MGRKKKRRRKNGTGSVRVLKNGKVELQIRYEANDGKHYSKSFTAENEARCWERAERFLEMKEQQKEDCRQIVESHEEGMDVTIPDLVKYVCNLRLERNFMSRQGYERNIATLRIIEDNIIGRLPIKIVKKKQLDNFLNSITHYSNSMIQKIFGMLRQAYDIAVEEGIITLNLMRSPSMMCPKSDKPVKVVRGYTEEEQKKLLQAIEEHRTPVGRNDFRLQLLIELYSGMRMGEINALRPEDIDLENSMLHIHATVSRLSGTKMIIKDGTKTAAGMRDIPISATLRPLLEEALAKMKENKEGLVFYDHIGGKIISTSMVCNYFRRLCLKCCIPYYGQHALRHTFATRCIEAGIPAIVLKNWLGHTNIHVTLDTYADVFNRMNFTAIDRLDNYIDTINGDEKKGDPGTGDTGGSVRDPADGIENLGYIDR